MATMAKSGGRQPYTVRVRLDRVRGRQAPPRSFDLTIDRGKNAEVDVVDLSFSASTFVTWNDRDRERRALASDILTRFGGGDEVDVGEGLALGRLLHQRLLPSEGVRRVWYEALAIVDEQDRPLRLELCLPRGDLADVADLPFELLADDKGFLFRRFGWTVVRTLKNVGSRTWTLGPGQRAGLAWANPQLNHGRLDAAVFQAHETALGVHCSALGLVKVDSCEGATRAAFTQWLQEVRPLHVLSLVAHGQQEGGEVWFHADNHPRYPEDPGQPVSARDLAQLLRRAETQVALLWSCHGGAHHGVQGAVAEALIDTGNLAAVVASHAALRAEATGTMADALLNAIGGTAEGDLERAVTEARIALGEDDVQWAAPVYYARPLHDRSVWSTSVEEIFELPPEPAVRSELIGAPPLAPHFRGRREELARVVAILRNNRLVSIVGMPGIGKSEIARRVVDDAMSDKVLGLEGAVWIDITDHETLEQVAARIGRAFGTERWDDKRALATAIGQRRALLVLDNAEDLLRSDPVEPPDFFGFLLQECPGLRLLLSSRRMLGEAHGFREHSFEIGCLPFDDARETFVATAGARLRPEDRESEALNELIRGLEGHPRSLYLVAGQVGRDLTLAELWKRIERDRDAALLANELLDMDVPLADSTKQDRLLRARRLVSSLNLAWAPLWQHRPEAAETLAWLGTLPAGLPGPLIPGVFGEEGPSLVQLLRRQYMVEVRDPDQTVFLPAPLRWYAEKQVGKISASRRIQLLTATVRALGTWMDAAESAVGRGPAGLAIGRAATQTANLAAIVDRWKVEVIDSDEDVELALSRALSQLFSALIFAGQPSVALGMATEMEELAGGMPTLRARAICLHALGELYAWVWRLLEAERCYEQALTLFRETKDRRGEASTLRAQGDLYQRFPKLPEAERCYKQALRLFREMGPVGQANTLRAQGDLYQRLSELTEAERCYEQALRLYQEMGGPVGQANTLRAQGDLYTRVDRLVEAERCYEQALPLYREIGYRRGEADTLRAEGDLHKRADRLEPAERCYEHALLVSRGIEDRLGEAHTLSAQGDLCKRMSRLEEAERCYGEALALYRETTDRLGEATTLRAVGELCKRVSRLEEAERCYALALVLSREISDRRGEATVLRARGDLLMGMSRLEEADRCYEQALAIFRETTDPLGEGVTLQSIGALRNAQNRPVEGWRLLRRALEIQEQAGNELAIGGTVGNLASTALTVREFDRALCLGGPNRTRFQRIGNGWGEMLILDDIASAAAGRNDNQLLVSALLLVWIVAERIDDPSAKQRSEQLSTALGLDLSHGPPEGLVDEAEAILAAGVQAATQRLADAGIDPLSDLEEP